MAKRLKRPETLSASPSSLATLLQVRCRTQFPTTGASQQLR